MAISRNQSIASWMASLVLGTFVGAWGFATAHALLRGGVVRWVVLMAVCSALAVLQIVVLGAVDLFLLWIRSRMLPHGRKAWLGSIASAALVGVAGMHWPFARWSSPFVFAASIVLPMLCVSMFVRLVSGERV